MLMYVVKRLLIAVPTLVGMSLLIFLVLQVIPGSIIDQMAGTDMLVTTEMRADLEARFGLDAPVPVQYWRWLTSVARGDLGLSWRMNEPVINVLGAHLGLTAELAGLALLIALVLGIPAGILAALQQNRWLDHVLRIISLASLSMPIFWQAAMLLLFLSTAVGWGPPVGFVSLTDDLGRNLATMLLPAFVLGTATSAVILRMTRASMLETLRKDYVRTARAKGLAARLTVGKHALRNALVPILTVAGLQLGYLLGGAVVTEQVFALPGLGRLTLLAIGQRDYPLLQGAVLLISTLFVTINILVDALYVLVDPRIRYDSA